MPQEMQETFLSNIADNLLADMFEGTGSSSSNVITATDEDPSTKDETKPEPAKIVKDRSFSNPTEEISTEELIGDILKEDPTKTVEEKEPAKETKPTKPSKRESGLGFNIEDFYADDLLLPLEDETDPEKNVEIKDIASFKELIKINKKAAVEQAKEEALKTYKENLPKPAQVLLEYAEKGGEEFGTLIKYLSQDQKQKELNLENAEDQKEIIRNYYASQEWTDDEINDEIEDLLDAGTEKLKDRAARLKPKLDVMNQKQIQAELEKAKELDVRREEARQFYVKNVTDSLSKGKLGSLPITKDEQADIFRALVEEKYNSFGGVTNRLGALLDKIQYVEPNYELLGKVVLMLSDPEAYDKKVLDRVKQEVTAETVKKLKSQQGLKKGGSSLEDKGTSSRLPKLNSGFQNPFV
jgi:hypothetical protein